MKFYSGFSLKNDKHFFSEFIKEGDYCVAGFSYGAIKAFEDIKKQLSEHRRVDVLQLFSPAFFQTKTKKFKRVQSISYKKNIQSYLSGFITSCFAPYDKKKIEHNSESNIDELDELLNYEWSISQLKDISQSGVKIEVYLGGEDRIIDADEAKKFFLDVATVTYVKKANHFLQID